MKNSQKSKITYKTEYEKNNKTHKILWLFEIQTDHTIQTTRPDLIQLRENILSSGFWHFNEPYRKMVWKWKKKKKKKKNNIDKFLDLARDLKNHETWN